MWFRKKPALASVFFTNTLSGAKEEFRPITPGTALLYSCGPTVYGPVQVGNLRSFVLGDLVARVLSQAGYKVKRVMNITDVGHMVGDGDEGEDKMAAGAKRDKATPEEVASKYAALFKEDIAALNLDLSAIRFPRATEYVNEDIEMIRALERKGFTYKTEDGVYFDAGKFADYGALGGLRKADLQAGARVAQGGKRSPHDFVLWRAAKEHDLQQWDSPWGRGNPGWSIECSAMATALLAPRIDLHTGGEDLAQIHHNNEIAQSECASGMRPFVRYWLHGAFLTAGGEKLSKSAGNSRTLGELRERGTHPLALRYLFLQAHYRSPLSFTLEALDAAQEGLERLWKTAREVKAASGGVAKESDVSRQIRERLADDLKTPQALALLHEALGSSRSPKEKWGALLAADEVLGLSLATPPTLAKAEVVADELPEEIRELAARRAQARKNRDFEAADELRIHLLERGYRVEDGPSGPVFTKVQKE